MLIYYSPVSQFATFSVRKCADISCVRIKFTVNRLLRCIHQMWVGDRTAVAITPSVIIPITLVVQVDHSVECVCADNNF